jgi:hypothetical protein
MTPEHPSLFSHQRITKKDRIEIKTALISELKQIINLNPKPKKWLKSAELKKLLQMAPGTLQNLRSNDTLLHRNGQQHVVQIGG